MVYLMMFMRRKIQIQEEERYNTSTEKKGLHLKSTGNDIMGKKALNICFTTIIT
jgi:hypothetical protein